MSLLNKHGLEVFHMSGPTLHLKERHNGEEDRHHLAQTEGLGFLPSSPHKGSLPKVYLMQMYQAQGERTSG